MRCRRQVRLQHPIWPKGTPRQPWPWWSCCWSPVWSSCCCSTVCSWATSCWSCQRGADWSGRTRRSCCCSPPCAGSGGCPTWPSLLCRTGGEPTCPCRSPSCPIPSPPPGRHPGRGPGWITGSGSWGRTAPPARGPWGRRAPSGPRLPRPGSARDSTWPPARGHTASAKRQAGARAHRSYRSPVTQRRRSEWTWFRRTLQRWVGITADSWVSVRGHVDEIMDIHS